MLTEGSTLWGYVGRKSGKLYTPLAQHPVTAGVYLRAFLKYEPNPQTGGTIFRTDQEINALKDKFVLKEYKVVANG